MSLDATTYAELREIAARYPEPRSGLLPMLHLVQSGEGRITPAGIEACAEILEISAAEVHGVATFSTRSRWSRQTNLRWSLRINAPGRRCDSHRIWNPLQIPRTGIPR